MSAEPTYAFVRFGRRRRNSADLVYYFKIVEENGKIVTPSQGYSRKIDRDKTVNNLRKYLSKARIIDA